MGYTLAQKIIKNHLVSGEMKVGTPISIKIDQTLTQDATGTMAYLQFEALGIPKVRTELSVSYVDHNMLQSGYMNNDDHVFLQSIAKKHGIIFSRPGNGICHQLHLERFAKPGKTLLGSDSHTPTGGGMGMIAIGAGGLDVALAMAGQAFNLSMPKIVEVHLTGKLNPFVTAKDVILELLRIMTVKGGVGKIIEYTGEGVKTLSVPERATITNMGAELGATCSIFPSDETTREFLKKQGRIEDWIELKADQDAVYDEKIEINLSQLEPMIAKPHMPDKVVKVKDLKGTKVDQVVLGSCTNSSYEDLFRAAQMIKGKKVHNGVSCGLSPGSRQVFLESLKNGAIESLIAAGVRLLEVSCGACIGMGFSPKSDGVSLRTFNRNFEGRSGTKTANVYLVSPETAIASAITGEITDPRELGLSEIKVPLPEKFIIEDSMFIEPAKDGKNVEIIRGPNIKPLPINNPLPQKQKAKVILKVEDNITTDHIMPAGSKVLPLRSNIPEISKHVFEAIDPKFYERAKEIGASIIVGGQNYGQGSSREHAALAPMYLGVKAVLVKSFARIHLANLVNFGIVPITFKNEDDYNKIDQNDEIEIDFTNISDNEIIIKNLTKNIEIPVIHPLSPRDVEVIKAGGSLNYAKSNVLAANRV